MSRMIQCAGDSDAVKTCQARLLSSGGGNNGDHVPGTELLDVAEAKQAERIMESLHHDLVARC